jgi:hypothetical protein
MIGVLAVLWLGAAFVRIRLRDDLRHSQANARTLLHDQ